MMLNIHRSPYIFNKATRDHTPRQIDKAREIIDANHLINREQPNEYYDSEQELNRYGLSIEDAQILVSLLSFCIDKSEMAVLKRYSAAWDTAHSTSKKPRVMHSVNKKIEVQPSINPVVALSEAQVSFCLPILHYLYTV